MKLLQKVKVNLNKRKKKLEPFKSDRITAFLNELKNYSWKTVVRVAHPLPEAQAPCFGNEWHKVVMKNSFMSQLKQTHSPQLHYIRVKLNI